MNILLAGGSCSLVDSLILKLRKEGHRFYILTGDTRKYSKNMNFHMTVKIWGKLCKA